jgi:tetratricopeptide (TPR) repeat protein
VGKWALLLVTALGCSPAQSPLAGGAAGEDAAMVAMLTAHEAGDCARVQALAAGFSTRRAIRLARVDALLGQCAFEGGAFETAISHFDRVALDPEHRWTRAAAYYGGRAHDQLGAYGAAVVRFDALLACCAGTWLDNARYYRARALYRLDDFEAARAGFSALLAQPEASAFYRSRAMYRMGKSHYLQSVDAAEPQAALAEARRWYARVLAEYGAESVADEAAYAVGKSHYRGAGFTEALAAFERVLATYPTGSATHRADYYRGRTLLALDRPLEAADHLAGFGSRWPESSLVDNAWYYQGRALYAAGLGGDAAQFTAARAVFEALAVAQPDSRYGWGARYYGARAAYHLGQRQRALPELVAVAESPSSYADNARHYAGMCEYHLGVSEGAAARFEAALAHFDQLEAAYSSSSYRDDAAYFAGRALTRLGRLAEADGRFGWIIEHAAGSYLDNAHRRRVEVRVQRGDCAAAQASFEAMQRAVPESAELAPAARALEAGC